jgi:NADH-quinone oxidoreductase subunit M
MEMRKNVKKQVVKLYLHLSWIFIYANRFCLFIPTSGKLLIRRFIKLNLSATEQLWIFLPSSYYAIKIHLFVPYLQASVPKSTCKWERLLSGIMLKNGLYSIIRWQLLSNLQQKSTCISSSA